MSENEGANGVTTPGRDALALVGVQNSPAPPQQVAQPQNQVVVQQQQHVLPPQHQVVVPTQHLTYNADGAAVFRMASASSTAGAAASSAGEGSSGSGAQPKKRGRPRRYGPDGAIGLSPAPSFPSSATTPPSRAMLSQPPATPPQLLMPPPPSRPAPPTTAGGLASPPPPKKPRGRPPGSSNRKRQQQPQPQPQQIGAMGSTSLDWTPHVLNVLPGEDLCSKIMSFTQHGPRNICILAASGCISSVTLRQPDGSWGTITYEGRFELLSLSGSFLLTEVGGQRTRTGGLSVTLIGPDGRIMGGSVAGLLITASDVKVIMATFLANGRKEPKPVNNVDPLSPPPRATPAGAPGASSPPSRGTHAESAGGSGSPLDPAIGSSSHANGQGKSSMPWK